MWNKRDIERTALNLSLLSKFKVEGINTMETNSTCFRKRIMLFLIILFSLFSSQGYSEMQAAKEYIIGPEDVLEIKVWGNDDLTRTVEVSQEGFFTFPLIGNIQTEGLSVFELENRLKQRLSEGYLKSPQITINISKYKSQKVIILGEIKKPGSYVIKGKTHLLEIISLAEGFTEKAGKIVKIVSTKDRNFELDLDLLKNGVADERFFVQNGDSIYINKAPAVYVTGEVNKPGEYKWEKDITVHQAISLAGGPTKRGALNRPSIMRSEEGKELEFKPKLSDLVKPNDIINVPEKYF